MFLHASLFTRAFVVFYLLLFEWFAGCWIKFTYFPPSSHPFCFFYNVTEASIGVDNLEEFAPRIQLSASMQEIIETLRNEKLDAILKYCKVMLFCYDRLVIVVGL